MYGRWMGGSVGGRINRKVDEWMDLWLWEDGWMKLYWAQIRSSEEDRSLPHCPGHDLLPPSISPSSLMARGASTLGCS